tara:strand:+ start:940 stop:2511 length:1572 start_codon:yes stop_codon:yes gene_type:complete
MANFSLLAKLGLDSKGFKNGLDKAQKRVDGFGKRFGKVIGGLGVKLGALGAVLAAKQIASLGVAAEETASKFKAVFGSATDEMNKKLLELQKTIPATKVEMQNALATFANMAKAFGFTSEAANEFSVEMVKIGGDIASFHNLRIEDAFLKIRSAISGEMEPLKALGIVINEDRIKTEALTLGIIKQGEALSVAGKAMAVYSILVKDMGDANGDAALTADSAANKLKFLRQEIIDNATAMGNEITPAIATFTGGLLTFISTVVDGTEKLGKFIGQMLFMGGLSEEEFTAKLQLEKEGAFGTLTHRGGHAKIRRQLIKDRVELNRQLKKEREEQQKADLKAKEDAIKNSKDVESELKNQIETEIDPRRKKALEDRLNAYQQILKVLEDSNVALEKIKQTESKTSLTGGSKKGDKDIPEDPFEMAKKIAGKSLKVGGSQLAKLATEIAKAEGMRGTRFQRFQGLGGEEMFRRFDSGRLSGEFTKQQIAAGIGKKAQAQGEENKIVVKLDEILDSIEQVKASKLTSE